MSRGQKTRLWAGDRAQAQEEWRVKELERLEEVEAQTPDQVVLKQRMIETQTAICDVEDGILNLKEALGVMSLPPLAEVQLLVAINKARRAVKRLYKVQRKAPFFAKHGVSKYRWEHTVREKAVNTMKIIGIGIITIKILVTKYIFFLVF